MLTLTYELLVELLKAAYTIPLNKLQTWCIIHRVNRARKLVDKLRKQS